MADAAFFEGRQTQQIPPGHAVVPTAALRTVSQKLDCNPVGSISLSPIVQDPNIGDYVRDMLIFGPSVGTADPELILSLRLHALSAKQLEIMTPAHVV